MEKAGFEVNYIRRGFPGGSVVKNTLASAGDMGWIHDLRESLMPRNN